MATVQKFDTANRAGGRQFVAHRVMIGNVRHSVWFSDVPALVDAERFDKRGVPFGVRRSSPRWAELEKLVPGLIKQYERETAAYLAERREPEADHA